MTLRVWDRYAICLKALRESSFFSFPSCARPLLRIHYERPELRIGLCWEATRAQTPGPRPRRGSAQAEPWREIVHWDWHQSAKSQGRGDGVPTQTLLLSPIDAFRPFRSLAVSALSSETCLRPQLLQEPIPLTGCRNHYSASVRLAA